MARMPLAYAPKFPPRPRWVRRALVVLVAVSTLACAVALVPHAALRLRILHLQRRCLNYAAPPDHVVLETDPARQEALLAADASYRRLGGDAAPVIHAAPLWLDFYRLLSPPGRWPAATLFLGRLQAPGGPAHLVCLELRPPRPNQPAAIEAHVFQPGTLLQRPRLVVSPLYTVANGLTGPQVLRAYAGRPDPSDPSHFSISYEMPDGRRYIDGWLRPDHSILLEPRTTPP